MFERADWLYLSRRNGAGIHQSRVCLPSLKKRMGSSLSYRFLEHARNWRNLIGWFRGWKLKNTDFSRKIKTPDWCIYHTGIEMENFFPISLSPWSGWTQRPLRCFFFLLDYFANSVIRKKNIEIHFLKKKTMFSHRISFVIWSLLLSQTRSVSSMHRLNGKKS